MTFAGRTGRLGKWKLSDWPTTADFAASAEALDARRRLAGRLELCASQLRRVETCGTVEDAQVIPGGSDHR